MNTTNEKSTRPSSASEPPNAILAEQAVIGCILSRPDLLDKVSQLLDPEDFYVESHRVVYSAMVDMTASGESVDFVGVHDRLLRLKQIDRAGGHAYLAQMVSDAPSGSNIEHYVGLIRDCSMRRKVIRAANDIRVAAESSDKLEQSVACVVDDIFRIMRSDGSIKAPEPVGKLLPTVLSRIEDRLSGGDNYIKTGFDDLDAKLLGGFRPSDLIIIAGRPSMGKTALAMQIGANAAIDGKHVMVFTLEMSKHQLTERLLSQIGGISYSRIISGNLEDSDYDKITHALGRLYEAPLFIDDTGGLSVSDIAARARLQAKTSGLSMIIVDYLQIMSYRGNSISRNDQLSEMSRQMKALAKELNVPFILLSQLNREVERRQDKRPAMSDLRESGAIEQDADVIIMMYRDEYYNPDSDFKGVAEAIIRKNRNGEVGTVGLGFDGSKVRFFDLTERFD